MPAAQCDPQPHARTAGLLQALYGKAVGAHTAGQVEKLIATHRITSTRSSSGNALSQHDALLITYADQVRAPGEAPLQTLASFAAKHLRGVVSGIHILPLYPWSSDDGFSVKDYFAVERSYGTWEDIVRLGGTGMGSTGDPPVSSGDPPDETAGTAQTRQPGPDMPLPAAIPVGGAPTGAGGSPALPASPAARFDLMLDAVFNHMSAQSDWFQRFLRDEPAFRDFFVTVEGSPDLSQVIRPRALPLLTEFQTAAGPKKVWTTFSADQVDLNFKNPDVLLATLQALLLYVRNGARFIRLDAIAFLWKEIGTTCLHLPQTHRVIQLMRDVLDEVAPGVRLITETNVPHADNVSYFGDGTNEAQLVYNFALPPLTLHSLQTGNAAKLTRWAQSLTLPSDQVTFFNFLASHDGIGLNPARGILSDTEINALIARTLEHGGYISYKNLPDGSRLPYEMNINYLDALSNPAANEPAELAARKFLTAQAILLSLQGVPGIYFHSLFGSRGDRAGAESSGISRRINREKLERARLEAELADAESLRARVFGGYSKLLRLRCKHAAFAPASPQRVLNLDSRVFAVLRETPDGRDRVLCLHNVSGETVNVVASRQSAANLLSEEWRCSAESPLRSEGFRPTKSLRIEPWASCWLSLA